MRFRLRLRFFCLCLVVSRADAHASWRARNSVTFSAMAHSDKQISRQISTIVFSSALVETLLIQLGNRALYVLFGSYKKTERIQLLVQCYFQTQKALQFALTLSLQLFSTSEVEGYRLSFFECRSVYYAKC